MHQHALNAVLERDCARVARPTRPTQLEQDLTILEAAELDVAAVLLDGRPHARVEQLLDHADDLGVVLVVREAVDVLGCLAVLGSGFLCDGVDDGLAAGEKLVE